VTNLPVSSSSVIVQRAEAQLTIFAAQPSRMALYELPDFGASGSVRVRVHRNVAAERLMSPAAFFARFASIELLPEFEAYDDTLSFAALHGPEPDVELVWLDVARLPALSGSNLGEFLVERLGKLRSISSAPILVLDVPSADPRSAEANACLHALAERGAAILICPQSEVAADMAARFSSARAAEMTAVPLSPAALMRLAQLLGLCWLPAAVGQRVRGIAIDLDNTIYSGVLGEDGVEGITVTEAHLALQNTLKSWHERGVFIVVLSKNEPADVQALFSQRADFALSAADIDAWGVGWGEKSVALERAAAHVRVSPETFIFLDDNLGELVEVGVRHPGLLTIHAADPEVATQALTLAPGLFRFRDAGADSLRIRDLAVAAQREKLREHTTDPGEYLSSLDVVMTYGVDLPRHIKRLAELSSKTNQFTTALARLDEVQLAQRTADERARVVSVGLSDRLANAGIICMISARQQPDKSVLVEDVCVSCRALGRGLETSMLNNALARIAADFDVTELRLRVIEGPRNGPARSWLSQLGGRHDGVDVIVPAPLHNADLPITVTWES
jgi:FkbH-like protein